MTENLTLEFSPAENQSWPVSAKLGQTSLVFSGRYTSQRLALEQSGLLVARLVFWLCWVMVGVSMAVLLFVVYQWFVVRGERGFGFLLTWPMSLVFVGGLAACFLWARKQYDVLARAQLLDTSRPVVDVFNLFLPELRQVWSQVSVSSRDGVPDLSKLLQALASSESMRLAFLRFGLRQADLAPALESAPGVTYAEKIPFLAMAEARTMKSPGVSCMAMFIAILKQLPEDHALVRLFYKINLTSERVAALGAWEASVQQIISEEQRLHEVAKHRSDKGVNIGLTAVPTPHLDQFSRDLTLLAKYHQLPLAYGRSQEAIDVAKLLSSSKNVLVVGGAGSGRSTVLAGLAYHMAGEDVPASLQDYRLVELETAAISGSNVPAQQVLLSLLDEAAQVGNIVLVLPNLEVLARARTQDNLVLLDFLLGHLQNSSVRVVATSTPEEYQTKLKISGLFDRVFSVYELGELNGQDLLLAACVRASFLESQYRVVFQLQSVEAALDLSSKLVHDTSQLSGAVQFLATAAEEVAKRELDRHVVAVSDVQNAASSLTHVPSMALGEGENKKLLGLEGEMFKYVVGQKEAVQKVADGIRRARSGLAGQARPLASFLFVGPTGVGKTEVARTLSRVYFGEEKYLFRLDMSEYQGMDGVEKLLGRAGGEEPTAFVKHLDTYPFCLFLLDELEKASSEVLNLFLQVLEDGRLTTAAGKTLDLRQTIIIATSNAGTTQVQEALKSGKTQAEIEADLKQNILPQIFRPEFLNRFDAIVLFGQLSHEEVARITELQLLNLAGELEQKRIKIHFAPEAISKIATEGYDALLGARPIRRYIQDHVESEIAKLLLSKSLAPGSIVTLGVDPVSHAFTVTPTNV